jgi:hypothetical protein
VTPDLRTRYLGMELRSPLVASASPLTGELDGLRRVEDAGADALELNLYTVAADPRFGAAELEARYLELVAAVRAAVTVPLAVKLSPLPWRRNCSPSWPSATTPRSLNSAAA